MKQKLIFLDIDGTLTPPGQNTPPKSALEAIRKARANGHRVFLCTGRNRGMLAPVLALGFDGAVASAGGFVFTGDKILYDCPMTAEQYQTAMALLGKEGVFRTVETRDASYCDENLGDFLAGMSSGNSELERWRAALEKEFNFLVQDGMNHGVLNGEMINRQFDKGRGVRIMAEALGFDIADTIGFGDSMNDLEMIETVGVSVCMDNGSPLLKSKSSMVCPAVDADGLAWAFDRLGLCGE